jgi:organic radical activating enzyme
MKLEELHILLTYLCNYECDHCFVWGSPRQSGTLTLEEIGNVLGQAQDAGVTSICFEGGEPFLYYAILKKAVYKAAAMGFSVGIVTNAYWANTVEDAVEWLQPFVGRIDDLSVSSDRYHCEVCRIDRAQNAVVAARWMGIRTSVISVAQLDESAKEAHGQHKEGQSGVMYRGRAVEGLAPLAIHHPWEEFDSCPHEDLAEPGRIHLDPLSNLHICHGIIIGNLFEKPLSQVCEEYDVDSHPICGLLHAGGPAALVTEFNLEDACTYYADACHLCYTARTSLRGRFPDLLGPDQMYGVMKWMGTA